MDNFKFPVADPKRTITFGDGSSIQVSNKGAGFSQLGGSSVSIPNFETFKTKVPENELSTLTPSLQEKLWLNTPWTEHLRIGAHNFLTNTVGMAAQELGTLSPEELVGAVKGDARTWDNQLSEWSQKMFGIRKWGEDYMKDNLENPIEKNPGSFDMGDAGWWSARFGDLGSIAGIMLEATGEGIAASAAASGIGTVTGGIGGAAIEGVETVRGASKLAKAFELVTGAFKGSTAAKTAFRTSFALSNGREALIESAQVFDENYNNLVNRGIDSEKAKEIAASAAALDFRSNFVVKSILGYLESGAMTYSPIKGLEETGIVGKVLDKIKNPILRKAAQVGVQSGGEGFEEAYQQVIQYEGSHKANVLAGIESDNNFITDRLPDYLTKAEVWNQAIVGAVGGGTVGPLMGYGINKIQSKLSGQDYYDKLHNSIQKEGQSIETDYVSKIYKAFEEGNTELATEYINALTKFKSVHSLYLDSLSSRGKEHSLFDDHLNFLENTLSNATENSADHQMIRKVYPNLIEQANRARDYYNDELENNTPTHLLVPTVYSRLTLDSINKLIGNNNTFIQANDKVISNLELSSIGRQLHELGKIVEGSKRNIEFTEAQLKNNNNSVETRKQLLDILDMLQSEAVLNQKLLNSIEDTRTSDEKESDNRKIEAYGNQLKVDKAKFDNQLLENRKKLLEKELGVYRSKEFQDRTKVAATINQVKNSKTKEELEANVKQVNDTHGIIPSNIADVARETVSRLETKNSTPIQNNDSYSATEIENMMPFDGSLLFPPNEASTEKEVNTLPWDENGNTKDKAIEDINNIALMQSPKSTITDKQKRLAGLVIGDYVSAMNKDNPSFSDVIGDMINRVDDISKIEKMFDTLKEGWRAYTGKDISEEYFYKVYGEYFVKGRSIDILSKLASNQFTDAEISAMLAEQVETETEKTTPIPVGYKQTINLSGHSYSGTEATLAVSGVQARAKLIQDESNPHLQQVVYIDAGKLFSSKLVNERVLADPNKFKTGSILTAKLYPNYEQVPYTPRDENGVKLDLVNKAPLYGELLSPKGVDVRYIDSTTGEEKVTHLKIERDSDEFWGTVPIVAYEKGTSIEDGSAFIHTTEWYNVTTIQNDNHRMLAKQQTMRIRNAFRDSTEEVELQVIAKKSGVFDNVIMRDDNGKDVFKPMKEVHGTEYGFYAKGKLHKLHNGKLIEVTDDLFPTNKDNLPTGMGISTVRFDFKEMQGDKEFYMVSVVKVPAQIPPDPKVVSSVVQAIMLYTGARGDNNFAKKKIREFASYSGFDIGTIDGLRKYVQNFIYTSNLKFHDKTGDISVTVNDDSKIIRAYDEKNQNVNRFLQFIFRDKEHSPLYSVLNNAARNVGFAAVEKYDGTNPSNITNKIWLLDENSNPYEFNKENGGYEDYNDYALSNLYTNMRAVDVGPEGNPIWTVFPTPVIEIGLAEAQSKEEPEIPTVTEYHEPVIPTIEEIEAEVKAEEPEIEIDTESIEIIKKAFNALSGLYSFDDRKVKSIKDVLTGTMESPKFPEPSIDRIVNSRKRIGSILPHEEAALISSLFGTISNIIGNETSKERIRSEVTRILDSKSEELLIKLEPIKLSLEMIDKTTFPNVQSLIDDYDTLFNKLRNLKDPTTISDISDMLLEEFNSTGIKIKDIEDEDITEEEPSNKDQFDKQAEEYSVYDRANEKIRRFLFGQPNIDKDGNQITTFLGLPAYVDKNEGFNVIVSTLADSPSNFTKMLTTLKENSKYYPWLWNINTNVPSFVKRLQNSGLKDGRKSNLQNTFIVAMTTNRLDMKFLRIDTTGGGFQLQAYDSNASSVGRSHVKDWQDRIKSNSTFMSGDDFIFDRNKAKQLIADFEALKGTKVETDPAADKIVRTDNSILAPLLSGEEFTTNNQAFLHYFKDSDTLNVNTGSQTYRITKVKDRFKSKRTDLLQKTDIKKYAEWLRDFGINVSDNLIQHYNDEGITINNKLHKLKDMIVPKADGIFNYVLDRLKIIAESEKPITFGQVVDNKSFSFNDKVMLAVARDEAKYSVARMVISWRDGGKTFYGFTATSFADDRVNYIKQSTRDKNSMLLRDPYSKDSMLLDVLANSSEANDRYSSWSLSPNAIKQVAKKSFADNKITNLSDADHELVKVGLFQDTTQGEIPTYHYEYNGYKYNLRYANMFSLTMSDKTKMKAFTTVVVDTSIADYTIDNNSVGFNDNLIELLYQQIALPELRRIDTYNRRGEHNIAGYEGNQFYNVPVLNRVKFTDANGNQVRLVNVLGTEEKYYFENIETLIKSEIKDKLKTYIEFKAKEKLDSWKANGIILPKSAYLDSKYMRKWNSSPNKEVEYLLAASEYVFNSHIHDAEMLKLYSGDPSFYFKSKVGKGKPISELSDEEVIQRAIDTYDNISKRLALLIAPGNKSADSEFNSYIQINLDDNVIKAVSYEQYVKYLGVEAAEEYLNVTETDAQEYTTWQEHITLLEHLGRVPDSMIDFTPDDLAEARKLFSSDKKESDFTQRDKDLVKKVLQPIKPVYTGAEFDQIHGIIRPVYVKSSSYPLIPQLTEGLVINDLRLLMEAVERKEKKSVRASYQTANKIGAVKNALKIFDAEPNGTPTGKFSYMNDKSRRPLVDSKGDVSPDVMDNIIKVHSHVLQRKNFRIQMDVPYKSGKKLVDEVSLGTQMNKTILGDGVINLSGFKIGNRELDGKAIYNENIRLFKELIEHKVKVFEEEFGSLKDLERLLKLEAKDNGLQDYDSIKLFDDNQFLLPIWASPNAWKYEALLQSIINKRIIKIKMPGYSYVVGSSAGYRLSDNYVGVNKSRITWIDKPIDKLTARQLLIPSKFRDNDGKLIDLINDGYAVLVKDKGKEYYKLDKNKIHKELLSIISFRIPTSGHSSLSLDDIVGFLPNEVGDLMIVSPDKATQKGLDFDVDKENTYHYYTYMDDSGRIMPYHIQYSLEETEEKLKTATGKFREELLGRKEKILKNKIIELDRVVLGHEEVTAKTMRVLSTEYAKKQATAIQKLLPQGSIDTISFISDEFQKQYMMKASSGKAGTGAYSMDLVFNSTIEQIAAMDTKNSLQLYTWNDDEGKYEPFEVTIDGIASKGLLGIVQLTDKSRTVTEILAERQNIAVDNATLNLLGKLNLGQQTFDIDKTLCLLGFDRGTEVEDVDSIPFLFMMQPILRDYVNLVKKYSSNISSYTGNKEEMIVKELMEKYPVEGINTLLTYKASTLTNEKFVDNIKGNVDNAYQQSVLDLFLKFKSFGETIRQLQTATNLDSKGLGKSYFDTLDRIRRKDNIRSIGKLSTDFTGNYKVFNANNLLHNTLAGIYLDNGLGASVRLMDNLFPYRSLHFQRLIDEYKSVIRGNRKVSTDELIDLFTDVKKFIYSWSGLRLYDKDPQEERKDLFFDDKEIGHKSLASYVKDLLDSSSLDIIQRNPLLNSFRDGIIIGDVAWNKISQIRYNNAQAARFNEKALYDSFIDLLANEVELPEFNGKQYTTRTLVTDLIKYAYLEGGIQKANQFVKYISPAILQELPFAEKMRDIHTVLSSSIGDYTGMSIAPEDNYFGIDLINEENPKLSTFIIQYIQHNPKMLNQITANDLAKFSDPVYTDNKNKSNPLFFTMKDEWYSPDSPRALAIKQQPVTGEDGITSKTIGKGFYVYIMSPKTKTYYRIPTHGVFGMSEYVMGADNAVHKSLININTNDTHPKIKTVGKSPTAFNQSTSIKEATKGRLNDIELPLEGNSHENILKLISTHPKVSPSLQAYAEFLSTNTVEILNSAKIEYGNLEKSEGTYNQRTNIITLDRESIEKNAEDSARIYLHEATHAILVNTLRNDKVHFTDTGDLLIKVDENAPEYIRTLNALFNKAKQVLPKELNAVKNLSEFISEIMTRPELQKRMSEVKYDSKITLKDKFIQFIQKIFKYINPQANTDNVTYAAMSTILEVFEKKTSNIDIPVESGIVKQNLFTVKPIQSADKKAIIKASIATQYIGFAEGIKGSSTDLYRQQAGKYANTESYSSNDVIFVSIGGKRGDPTIRKEQQDKTIREAIKAIEAGATLITDNKSYVESSSYNEGEKRLADNLKAKGYSYSEIVVNNQTLGVWKKIPVEFKTEANDIYSKLGNKTKSTHIVIKPWNELKNAYQAITDNGIISTRISNSNQHFGNPFTPDPKGKMQGLIEVGSVKEAVEKYIDWVINSDHTRAKWIREKLQSGELKGKPILYYKELDEPSHATALDYLINNYSIKSETPKTINIYSTDKNGFEKLSNILNGPVTATINGKTVKFKTVEHLYQTKKALFAGDTETANKIYKAENGWEAQKLGRTVKGLDSKAWDKVAYENLEDSMRLAFEQNEKAKQLLLSTGDAILTHKAKFSLGRWEKDFPEILTKIRKSLKEVNKPDYTVHDPKTETNPKVSTQPVEYSIHKSEYDNESDKGKRGYIKFYKNRGKNEYSISYGKEIRHDSIPSLLLYLSKDEDKKYRITEASTGLSLGVYRQTQKEVLSELDNLIKEKGVGKILEVVENTPKLKIKELEENKPKISDVKDDMFFFSALDSYLSDDSKLPNGNEKMESPKSEKLSDKLISFLNGLNVSVEFRNDIKSLSEYDPVSLTDLIYKKIIIGNNYKNKALLKETAYVAYSFLGKKNKIRTDLIHSIENIDNYDLIYSSYKVKSPNLTDYKIKELVVIDFIADAIENDFNIPSNSYQNREADYWKITGNSVVSKKFKYLLSKLKSFVKNLFVDSKLTKAEINELIKDIAHDILTRNYSKFSTQLSQQSQLTNYDKTIKSDKNAEDIINNFQKLGIILTGSLSLRKQGTLYRESSEDIHDLDFSVTQSVLTQHDVELLEKIAKDDSIYLFTNKNSKIKKDVNQGNLSFINNIKTLYPEYKITNVFKSINGDDEFTIMGTINDYSIDLFIVNADNLDSNEKEFQNWENIFMAKLKMGREKDIRDFANYVPFNMKKDGKFAEIKGFRHFYFDKFVKNSPKTNLWESNRDKILEKYPELTEEAFNNESEEIQKRIIDCL